MSDGLSRRDLLKAAARMAALAALGGVGPSRADAARLDGLKWHKAPCRFCGTGCGVLVGVQGGRVVAVQGDRLAPVNQGLLCAKGYHAGMALYGEDRLTQPQVRRRGKLVPVSWSEAIDRVAREIMKDPARFSFYGSGQWTIPEGYAALKFMKGGLANNHIDPNARLCMASAVVGFVTTFGVDEPPGCYDDLDECDAVVTWGNNWAEMHPVLFSRFIDRKGGGAGAARKYPLYIDLGTRRTRSSEAADLFMQFQPQTDMVIANYLCHEVVARKAWDVAFVRDKVRFKADDGADMTWEGFVEFLADYALDHAVELTGIPAPQLIRLADLFCDPDARVVSLWCMGVNQHTRGTAMNNLIYNLHLLTGKIGKPGSTPFSLTGQPSACGTCREVGTLAHALPGGRLSAKDEHRAEVEEAWNLAPGTLNPKPGHHTVKLFKAFAAGEITGMWVQVTNPGQSMPNLPATMANAEDRFLVVSDVYPTATTRLASVVLPSAMWVEKNGVFGNSERRTHQWFRMVAPPGEARDDLWQTIAVAHRLLELGHPGMKDRDGRFLFAVRDEAGQEVPVWEWEAYRSINVDRHLFEEYRPLTYKKRKNLAPYEAYVAARGLRWPVVQDPAGGWRETPRRYVEGEDPFVEAGKGIDFYQAKAGDGRAIVWARPYVPPPEVPDDEYPFWLCTGRVLEHWHTGTMTGRVAPLRAAMPNAYVELNPGDARRLGIREGDAVEVRSRRGAVVLPAALGGRGAPAEGSVFVPFFDEQRLINLVTLDAYCPQSKEPDYKKCAVRLRRAS